MARRPDVVTKCRLSRVPSSSCTPESANPGCRAGCHNPNSIHAKTPEIKQRPRSESRTVKNDACLSFKSVSDYPRRIRSMVLLADRGLAPRIACREQGSGGPCREAPKRRDPGHQGRCRLPGRCPVDGEPRSQEPGSSLARCHEVGGDGGPGQRAGGVASARTSSSSASGPRISKSACSSTSSRPSRTPSMVGLM